jgi:nucleoside-diphosphate-sugar epimerase
VGERVAALLAPRVRVLALTSSPGRREDLRARNIAPLVGDLDQPATLRRLAGIAQRVLHLAPPPTHGVAADAGRDPRTLALLQALARRGLPKALVYGSTSGVYGDCGGAWVTEAHPVQPRTARARRRVDAEAHVRAFGRSAGVRASVLRIPGIYATDREGGTPRARLERGTPVLAAGDDVYTNHIHADDLARACCAALWRGAAQRTYHASDDTVLKMGDYFDLAADLYGLARPPRLALAEARAQLPVSLLSFMQESRRLDNQRMKRELRLVLRHPDVASGLLFNK